MTTTTTTARMTMKAFIEFGGHVDVIATTSGIWLPLLEILINKLI